MEDILRHRRELGDRVRCGRVPPACRGCFIAESIKSKVERLLKKRPRRVRSHVTEKFWRGGEKNAAGRIEFDAEAVGTVLAHCDGKRSVEGVLRSVAAQWRADAESTRRRMLPVISELARLGTIDYGTG